MEAKGQVFSNFIWRFLERCGAQGVSFIVSLVLARLIDPAVFGTIALIQVFSAVLNVFIDSGLGSALIQKKNADDLDFSSVFYFNVVVCLLLYAGMFFAAPYIAAFYGLPSLIAIIRVQSLILVISGVKNIQQAYISRNMLFKKFFFATLGGTIGAAVVGIWMAWQGYGVWALVTQNLFNATVDTVILWVSVKWRPKRQFSFARLKKLLSFGWKLLISGLLETVYNNLRQLLIGKIYTPKDLAFYNKGETFPYMIMGNVTASINSVLLPVLSGEQDKTDTLRGMTRRAVQITSYLVWPMMIGLAVCAAPLVRVVLTEKWVPCIPYIQVFCVSYAFWPVHTANLNAIQALGRSGLYLKLEILKKGVGLLILAVSLPFGAMAIAYGMLGVNILCSVINAWPNRTLLGYNVRQQLIDILPSILLSAFMGGCVWAVTLLGLSDAMTLIIQVPLGTVVYFGISALLKIESFSYLWDNAKKIICKKRWLGG